MTKKCKFNEENLKACSENDWDCAMCEYLTTDYISFEKLDAMKQNNEIDEEYVINWAINRMIQKGTSKEELESKLHSELFDSWIDLKG
jgi:hypothetical protein